MSINQHQNLPFSSLKTFTAEKNNLIEYPHKEETKSLSECCPASSIYRTRGKRRIRNPSPLPPSLLLDEALFAAAIGIRVLPLQPNGKRPLTRNGVTGASTDPKQIELWFREWPRANLGAAVDDLLVIDNDNPKKGGDLSLTAKLDSPMVLTPSGGSHNYFLKPNILSTKTSVENVDILTGNCYVLLPPSRVGGKPYQWVSGDLASLVNLKHPPVAFMRQLLGTDDRMYVDLSSIEEGARNNKLYGLGVRLLCFGYPIDLVALMLENVTAVTSGKLNEGEGKAIVLSVMRYVKRHRVSMWTSPFDRFSKLELSHKLALLSGVLRGTDASREVLKACFSAIVSYSSLSFRIGAGWINGLVENAMAYPPQYSHFLRRNGAADAKWRTVS